MLCQNCNKNEANTHIKRIVNGEATESHLCSDCAKSLGYDDFFDSFSLRIPNLFSSFFSDTPFALPSGRASRCKTCGCSFDDIISSGLIGCADCYETFHDRLLPSIQRIHGKAPHAGKRPKRRPAVPAEIKKEDSKASNEALIEKKTEEMNKAIESQNFEQAAVLRDEIKALKEEK